MLIIGDKVLIKQVTIQCFGSEYIIQLDIKPIYFKIFSNGFVSWGYANSVTLEKDEGLWYLYFEFDGSTEEYCAAIEIETLELHRLTKDDERQYRREKERFFEGVE